MGEPFISRRKRFLINFAYFAVCVAIYYVTFKYVIYAALPFVVAIIVTLSLRRPIKFLAKKLHIPRKGAAAVMLIVFYIITAGVVVGLIFALISATVHWIGQVPQLYLENIQPAIKSLLENLGSLGPKLPEEISGYFSNLSSNIIESLYSLVSGATSGMLSIAQSIAVGVPSTVFGLIFCIVSTIFLTLDYPAISYFFLSQFSKKARLIIIDSVEYVGSTFGHIIVSYGLIMFITFCELSIAFLILKIESPFFYAFLISLFDILPALGTGGILIPWTIIELVYKNWKLAIELIIVYLIIESIRETIEPKIVGKSIGIHPVLMLMSMYLGAKILGVMGIIILPFTLVVLRKLNDSGKIHVFNSDYYTKDEEDVRIYRRKKKESKDGEAEKENSAETEINTEVTDEETV